MNMDLEGSILRISGKIAFGKLHFSWQCPFLLILTCLNGGIAGAVLSFWRLKLF